MNISKRKLFGARLRNVIVIGVILCTGMYAYVHFTYARPIGEGPAGPAVAAKPFESIWSEQHVELVAIGDSITAGLGAKSIEHSYVNRLLDNPQDEFPDMRGKCPRRVLPNLTVENLAVSGSTSLQHEVSILAVHVRRQRSLLLVLLHCRRPQ